MQGVSWLLEMTQAGVNSILADEMGLGKTFQTLAMLAVHPCQHPGALLH